MGCVCTARTPEINVFMRNRTNNITKSCTVSSSKFVRELDQHPDNLYSKIAILGSGSFGKVYLVRQNQTGILYAMKQIKKTNLTNFDNLNEISILKNLDHANILKIYEYFHDESYIYIISEHCKGGELYTKLLAERRLKEKTVRKIMRQIFSAVFYCHSKNIIHRDLKPQNILIDDEDEFVIKIIDFGTSEIFSKSNNKVCIGTLLYMAPEVIKKSEYNKKYDLWSCGVIMYLLLSGELPFSGSTEESISEKIKSYPVCFESDVWDEVSSEAKDLIRCLLNRDVDARYSAEAALEHAFFRGEKDRNIPKRSLLTVCNNISAYNAYSIIHKSVLGLILQFIDKTKEIKLLRGYFKIIDRNQDGRISVDDLVDEFCRVINEDDALEIVQKLFRFFNKKDYIELEEFLLAALDRDILLSEKNMYIGFTFFDNNKDGRICNSDIKSILKDINDSEINLFFLENDINGDGYLDFNEFRNMILKVK